MLELVKDNIHVNQFPSPMIFGVVKCLESLEPKSNEEQMIFHLDLHIQCL